MLLTEVAFYSLLLDEELVDECRLITLIKKRGILIMSDTKSTSRDVEKTYSTSQSVEKLRRLADCLEKGERFDIQIAGERIYVPKHAVFNIEHERDEEGEEIEFQIKWKHND